MLMMDHLAFCKHVMDYEYEEAKKKIKEGSARMNVCTIVVIDAVVVIIIIEYYSVSTKEKCIL